MCIFRVNDLLGIQRNIKFTEKNVQKKNKCDVKCKEFRYR